jgi:hypothetical protein
LRCGATRGAAARCDSVGWFSGHPGAEAAGKSERCVAGRRDALRSDARRGGAMRCGNHNANVLSALKGNIIIKISLRG